MFGLFSKKKYLAYVDELLKKSLEHYLWIMEHTLPGEERRVLLAAEKSYRQAICDSLKFWGIKNYDFLSRNIDNLTSRRDVVASNRNG